MVLQHLAQAFLVDHAIEDDHADDHHQVAGRVHAQPRGIDRRHAYAVGHRLLQVAATGTVSTGGLFASPAAPPHNSRRQIDVQNKERRMADMKAKFEAAVAASKSLPERPDNATLLKMYALYKQATSGDVEGKRPGFTDMVGRAKWDAWNEIKGTAATDAMTQYIALIDDLKG